MKTFQAFLEPDGRIRFLENVSLKKPCKALITLLEDVGDEISVMSEDSLSTDWLRSEEEEAWKSFQKENKF